MEVVLSTAIEGRLPNAQGKVRDVYDIGNHLLLVTTDRISAFDSVMKQGVPFKGTVLHHLTKWWMQSLNLGKWHHFVTDDLNEIGSPWKNYPNMFAGRTMLVKKLKPLPIECIVRGYISGSAWKEYKEKSSICGIKLPQGIQMNQHLYRPIFTPSTKAEIGQHDINITCQQMTELLGNPELSSKVMQKSIELYKSAASLLWDKGIILADTKLEFGIDPTSATDKPTDIYLIDECFTPDSSRFWDFRDYALGTPIASMDKQYLRDWLTGRWDMHSPPPDLPPEVINNLSVIYKSLYERIVGHKIGT